MQVWRYCFDKVREKIKDFELAEETVDPYSIEALSHIEENHAC